MTFGNLRFHLGRACGMMDGSPPGIAMRRYCVFVAFLLIASPALALDAGDRTLEQGRVGAIVKGATQPADLARIYGAGNVVSGQIHLAEGENRPGAHIYRGTDNALQVLFTADGKSIELIRIEGKAWKTKEGIRIGTTLAELERINGGPFKFLGFGWDNGGFVLAGGKLPKGVSIALAPTRNRETRQARQLDGDTEFSSRHPALKNMGVAVSAMWVSFIQD
jgi:hypothetical protein